MSAESQKSHKICKHQPQPTTQHCLSRTPRGMVLLQLERFGNIIYNLMYKYIYFKVQVKL